LPKLNCFLTDLTKFDEIIKEYQEEIWDSNFIVFVKYFINERKSFQKFLR